MSAALLLRCELEAQAHRKRPRRPPAPAPRRGVGIALAGCGPSVKRLALGPREVCRTRVPLRGDARDFGALVFSAAVADVARRKVHQKLAPCQMELVKIWSASPFA